MRSPEILSSLNALNLRVKARLGALNPLNRWLVLIGLPLGILCLLLGVVYLWVDRVIAIGALSSILAGLATGAGALLVLVIKPLERATLNTLLGAAAGVMLAATSFSLIVPGIQYGDQIWPGLGVYVVALGILVGAGFLVLTDRYLPYEKVVRANDQLDSHRKIWLFIAAVTLHNLPEGGAVGVSFGSGDVGIGLSLAIAVALQNIPEGLAVALPLVALGYSRPQAIMIASMTGLIEPVGGILGVLLATAFVPVLPLAMGIAGGAMLFVISEDIIPQSQAGVQARQATFAMLIGFVVMMILDNLVTGA